MTASTIIANTPEQTDAGMHEAKANLESTLKQDLVDQLSLDDLRQLVAAAKSGALSALPGAVNSDTFDDLGRNFARMIHKVTRVTPSGGTAEELRPFRLTAAEARKEGADWYDPVLKTWVWRGVKRAKDYPENTVEGVAALMM